MIRHLLLTVALLCSTLSAQPRKLLVISIDGLDHRYLKDRDALGLRIPHLRSLIDKGAWADGVVGVVPTVTWPSHTTLITGVRPEQHGILDNNIQTPKGSERYWYTSYLKAPTLWQAASKAGLKTAAITWPVTVGDGIDYNLPEYFQGRAGGAMDLKSIEEKATPGLVAAIAKEFPSFATEWMDDRTRALGAIYILKHYRPDLTLLHFVDLDSAAHDAGPFKREANATLEYTDELIGQILAAVPPGMVVAVVSDHGFEAGLRDANLNEFLKAHKLPLEGTQSKGGYAITINPDVASTLAKAGSDPATCIGREIPKAEIDRFLPGTAANARLFEPAPGCFFVKGAAAKVEAGRHGHWPTRYKATFLIAGPGIKKDRLREMDMLDVVKHFSKVLGIEWSPRVQ